MKKVFFIVCLFIFLPFCVDASEISNRLVGRILLDVEGNGEAWYVYPKDFKRYYLGRPKDAFSVMRELGLGITELDFGKIASDKMDIDGDLEIAGRLAGQIVLQVEKNGEAWYINPLDLKKYYLGRPEDAFSVMRRLSLGILKKDLALINKPGLDASIDKYSSYKYKEKVVSNLGDFDVDIIRISLDNPRLRIITDTAQDYNCKKDCTALSLAEFATDNNAFAAMNGSYFDTKNGNGNYYFFPVFNTGIKKMINEDQLKYWTTGPIMAFDEDNRFYYFKDSREFKSVSYFEEIYNVKLQAAIGNKPRLVEDGKNLLIKWELDEKQETVKTTRNAIGYKKNGSLGEIFLVVAREATVPDLAEIMKGLEVDYALNMDGGYSSALFYEDEIFFGPGRDIPNAIMFSVE